MRPDNNAFPLVTDISIEYGLSKRELIAAIVLSGIVSKHDMFTSKREVVTHAIELTDQLIHQIDLDGKD